NKSIFANILEGVCMSANEDIRILMLKECLTLNKLSKLYNAQYETKFTPDGLSKKLRYNTLRYDEAKKLADVMGYELIFQKRM
ncbi:MAG: hypothetical protein LUE64_00900, partial [Candidatus Gastranaerophilales bacterium]|nr:hypothetical protein [Candidatus Gastranaerophilales bacterium]